MKDDLEVIINIGPPASGKSTYTKSFLKKNPNWVKISRDDYRYMLRNEGFCEPKIEKMITEMHNRDVLIALSNNLNVIIDNTNLKISVINEIIDLVHDYANVKYMVFDIPKKTLIERDSKRERSVGVDVIDKMYKQWEILKDSFDFQPVPKNRKQKQLLPNYDSDLPSCVVFDIDGTLAIMGDRSPFDFEKVDRDTLNDIVFEQLEFHKSIGRKIIIVSGRDESCRKLTDYWFEFYGVEYDAFFMRPEGDYRKDSIVKKEIIEKYIKNKYNILVWYDDRLQVLDMLYKEGIYTFSCNQGNKIF